MRRALATTFLLFAMPGCYLSHGRGESRPDAGPARRDAGVITTDAGVITTDAGDCDRSKLRTSGLAEDFALGARCEFLVVCMEVPRFDLVRADFPDARCDPPLDFACGGEGNDSCVANVGVLDEAEVDAGCALTLVTEVVAVVCAGDL